MDCSPPGSSVHEISQASILQWVALSSSRGSFPSRDGTCLSCLLHWQMGSLSLAPPGFIYHLLWETQISTSDPGLSDELQALRPAVCWPPAQHVPDRALPSPRPARSGSPSWTTFSTCSSPQLPVSAPFPASGTPLLQSPSPSAQLTPACPSHPLQLFSASESLPHSECPGLGPT